MGDPDRDYTEYNKEWDKRTQKIDERYLEGKKEDDETGMYITCIYIYTYIYIYTMK